MQYWEFLQTVLLLEMQIHWMLNSIDIALAVRQGIGLQRKKRNLCCKKHVYSASTDKDGHLVFMKVITSAIMIIFVGS